MNPESICLFRDDRPSEGRTGGSSALNNTMTSTTPTSKFSEIFVIDLQLLVVHGGGEEEYWSVASRVTIGDGYQLPSERTTSSGAFLRGGSIGARSETLCLSVWVPSAWTCTLTRGRTGRRILASQFSDVLTSPDSSFSTRGGGRGGERPSGPELRAEGDLHGQRYGSKFALQ